MICLFLSTLSRLPVIAMILLVSRLLPWSNSTARWMQTPRICSMRFWRRSPAGPLFSLQGRRLHLCRRRQGHLASRESHPGSHLPSLHEVPSSQKKVISPRQALNWLTGMLSAGSAPQPVPPSLLGSPSMLAVTAASVAVCFNGVFGTQIPVPVAGVPMRHLAILFFVPLSL